MPWMLRWKLEVAFTSIVGAAADALAAMTALAAAVGGVTYTFAAACGAALRAGWCALLSRS